MGKAGIQMDLLEYVAKKAHTYHCIQSHGKTEKTSIN